LSGYYILVLSVHARGGVPMSVAYKVGKEENAERGRSEAAYAIQRRVAVLLGSALYSAKKRMDAPAFREADEKFGASCGARVGEASEAAAKAFKDFADKEYSGAGTRKPAPPDVELNMDVVREYRIGREFRLIVHKKAGEIIAGEEKERKKPFSVKERGELEGYLGALLAKRSAEKVLGMIRREEFYPKLEP